MRHVLILLVFVTTMTKVYSTFLGELISGGTEGEELLKLKLLGKEKKRGGGKYSNLASQLSLDANGILADIDRHLVCDCDFKSSISSKVFEIKLQINKISNTLATADKDKNAKEKLQIDLNSLEFSITNLKNEIYRIQHKQHEKCSDILRHILELLDRLKLRVAGTVAAM